MDAELKTKWIAALRSGEFQQTTAFLRDGDGFCCLGVLCEIANINHNGQSCLRDGNPCGYEPIEVLLGDDENGRLVARLCSENDGGATFDEIADWIEGHL